MLKNVKSAAVECVGRRVISDGARGTLWRAGEDHEEHGGVHGDLSERLSLI